MDKMILNDGTSLEFKESLGLNIVIEGQVFNELESLLTLENLSKVEFSNSVGEIYGTYTNLQCVSMTKYMTNESIVVNLKEIVAQ